MFSARYIKKEDDIMLMPEGLLQVLMSLWMWQKYL